MEGCLCTASLLKHVQIANSDTLGGTQDVRCYDVLTFKGRFRDTLGYNEKKDLDPRVLSSWVLVIRFCLLPPITIIIIIIVIKVINPLT